MKRISTLILALLLIVGCSNKETKTLTCKGKSSLIEGGTVELTLVTVNNKTTSYETIERYTYESLSIENEEMADDRLKSLEEMFSVFNTSEELVKVWKEDKEIVMSLSFDNLENTKGTQLQMIEQLMGDLSGLNLENVKQVQENIGAICDVN